MSALLVNSALILVCSTAIVQFSAAAFASYAQETAISEIFGNEIYQLRGVRHIFKSNTFVWIMLGFSLLTILWILIRGPNAQKRKKKTLDVGVGARQEEN